MEIRIKLQPLYRNELNFSEAFCTVPIIMDKIMIWGAYDVDLNISEYIWCQLPEKFKEKIKNYKGYTIKSMIITVTDITAYSVSISNHEKLKDTITMEEIYEDFSESKKIERFLCECDFPYSNMSVYFQNLGEIYAEFELEDWVCYEKEAKEEWKIKERERRKIRETYKLESISLERIEKKQSNFEDSLKYWVKVVELTEEKIKEIFLKFPTVLHRGGFRLLLELKYMMSIIENSEKFKLIIPENVKNEIGYWLTDMQGEIRIEEEKNLFKEIREKLNLKKVYGD